jgi:FMN hydrolase / 5-amino-6-(5-phospho-D-ribitylamino)uracil phosphatase
MFYFFFLLLYLLLALRVPTTSTDDLRTTRMSRFTCVHVALCVVLIAASPANAFSAPGRAGLTFRCDHQILRAAGAARTGCAKRPGCVRAGAAPRQARTFLRIVAEDASGVVLNVRTEMAIDVLSFDLDGTLWPTEQVVRAANEEMQCFLNERYPGTPSAKDVQETMKAIRQRRRADAKALSSTPAPVSYTELRLAALELVTAEAGYSESESGRAAADAFNVWLDARNAYAGKLLFPSAQNMLKIVRREYPAMLVCAITNGRGDVKKIPELAEFFDFSISGEDEHIFPERKPSEKIYVAAVNRAISSKRGSTFLEASATQVPQTKEEEDAFNEFVARWVHVGDDLANDIGPARKLGMRTVLVASDDTWRQGISTMSPEEEAQRLARAAETAPHASIAQIAQLPQVLKAWSGAGAGESGSKW